MHRGTALVALVLLLAATCRADLAVSHATVPAIFGDDATRARGKVKTKAASAKLKGPGKAEKAKVSAGFVGVLRPTETYDGAQADLAIPGLAHDSKAQARDVQGPGPDAPPRSAFESDGTQRMRRELARPEADLMREEPGVSPNEVQALDTGTGTAENVVTTTELLTPDTLPDAPADIDDDSEQLHDEDEVPQSISQKAATAAERAMKAAHRGMVAFSGSWSACLEQARLATSACRFENVDRCVRQLPAVASRLVPPSPARKGLQTLVSESMALWAAALWKILMLQVLVIMKTVISQGNVIARSFIQAACLESNALVPDSPLLQRQRSRARAIAAKNQADAARERMKELNLMMAQTAEQLRAAERLAGDYPPQVTEHTQCKGSTHWSETAVAGGGGVWWGTSQAPQHVSFQGSSGSLSPASKLREGGANYGAPRTPVAGRFENVARGVPKCMSQALLMSTSRRTPLPASPMPPPTRSGAALFD